MAGEFWLSEGQGAIDRFFPRTNRERAGRTTGGSLDFRSRARPRYGL